MKKMAALVGAMMAGALWGAQGVAGFAECRREFLPERHMRTNEGVRPMQEADGVAWLKAEGNACRFRCDFDAVEGEDLVFDVSGDRRYVLWLDGKEISRGPHRGYPQYWMYSTYRVKGLTPGRHRMEAVVNQMNAPLAQLSVFEGLLVRARGGYDARLSTSKGDWKVARLKDTCPDNSSTMHGFGVGGRYRSKGSSSEWEKVAEGDWKKAGLAGRGLDDNMHWGIRRLGRLLFPSPLPDQMHEWKTPGRFRAVRAGEYRADETAYAEADGGHEMVVKFNKLLAGEALTIPPNTKLRALWDLEDYYCAYPYLETSGGAGAEVRWGWTEAPYDAKGAKGHRAKFDGMKFKVQSDRFMPDGREDGKFSAMWWACGRWCQVEVSTGAEPLTLKRIRIAETRYPADMESSFECDDPTIAGVVKICARGMHMCSHEMFFDCPYYEQQMYGGDSRTQFLTVGTMTRDDRLLRQAMRFFDVDRRDNGMLGMNTPTRGNQESVTYTLCWPLMLDDYLQWHRNPEWLKARVPGMRHTLSGVEAFERADGLLGPLPGWSFIDWAGAPIERSNAKFRDEAPSALNDLFYLLALQAAERVEAGLGNAEMAAHWRAKADRLAAAVVAAYWDEGKGLLADLTDKKRFSEHAQCLGLLAEVFRGDKGKEEKCFAALTTAGGLYRATVYFSHYLFETYAKYGRADLFMKRLDLWRDYVKTDLKTPLEAPGNARSDCHAWGSHPIYQLHATVLGVRPAASGFGKVRIAPQPCGLKRIKAKTPHPDGMIASELEFADGKVRGTVELPAGLTGEFAWGGKTVALKGGRNAIDM